ncbi:hypothetical protein DM02DRAFT_659714 [Periconia macrospinosa]|uniref:Uncharacterized protein n=1 Tax=Periconia macrospinosa TaxID=97972 RepID=A0A2V1DE91_9PLEO|nr:hypothetical protein DM02DRAFT_659714 [Periconia macrospinosa]
MADRKRKPSKSPNQLTPERPQRPGKGKGKAIKVEPEDSEGVQADLESFSLQDKGKQPVYDRTTTGSISPDRPIPTVESHVPEICVDGESLEVEACSRDGSGYEIIREDSHDVMLDMFFESDVEDEDDDDDGSPKPPAPDAPSFMSFVPTNHPATQAKSLTNPPLLKAAIKGPGKFYLRADPHDGDPPDDRVLCRGCVGIGIIRICEPGDWVVKKDDGMMMVECPTCLWGFNPKTGKTKRNAVLRLPLAPQKDATKWLCEDCSVAEKCLVMNAVRQKECGHRKGSCKGEPTSCRVWLA